MYVGVTRFSVAHPNSPDWKLSNGEDRDTYLSKLFAYERLSVREELFFNFSLPLLSQMAEKYDYCHIVQYSDELPQEYKDKIKFYEDKYDFLVSENVKDLSTRSTSFVNGLLRKRIVEKCKKNNQKNYVFGYFFLDDDDLLSSDFFDQVSPYLNSSNVGSVISLGSGYTAIFDQGRFSNFRKSYYPKLNIGLMSICAFNVEKDEFIIPVRGSHTTIDQRSPVILDSRQPAYLWTRHFVQDTSSHLNASDVENNILKSMERFDCADNSDLLNIKMLFNIDSDLKVKELLENERVLIGDDPIYFSVPSGVKKIKVFCDFLCPNACEDNKALISLICQKNTPPFGFYVSKNNKVGIYKYLKTSEEISRNEVVIEFDADNVCTYVGVRTWNSNHDIELVKFVIEPID